MKKPLVLAALLLAALPALADPVSVFRTCRVCQGRRALSLTPPNLGQNDGEIGVTPGKPFTPHRWDVKHPRCLICGGTGRMEFYRTKVPPPAPEVAEGLDRCPECRWAGVTPCRKCLASGLVACTACKSSRGGKPGWIKSEKRTSGSTSRHVKVLVTPCGTCGGIGRVVCPDCLGKGAQPCRKCKGDGGTPKKGPR